MLGNFIKQSWLVMLAALVFGLLVSGIFGQLDPRIKQNAKDKLEREMRNLLTTAASFEGVPDEEKPQYFIGKDEQGEVVGYAIQETGGGFADKITLLVGTDAGMEKLLGIGVLKTNETPGFGDKIKNAEFKDQFIESPAKKLKVILTGKREEKDEQIVSITGATISSEYVTKIVNSAIVRLRELTGIEEKQEEEMPAPRARRRQIR